MLFTTAASTSPLSVDVGEFLVYVAKVQPDDDPTQPPTWKQWKLVSQLKFEGAFLGSSVAGMSYAKLSLANGAPLNPRQINVEDDTGLNLGDRVTITNKVGNRENPLFSGYCTAGHIQIGAEAETIDYRISGPEWIWGGRQGQGAFNPTVGQVRRVAAADDAWVASGTVAADTGLYAFSGERCVFNPAGRKNMSAADVKLTGELTGRCWESPDRKVNGSDVTASWTVAQAAKTLELYFNDPDVTGIADPDWAGAGSIDLTKAIGEVDVDGLGLWEALVKVCGPEYAFYVDPRPPGSSKPSGDDWGPFQLNFFQRGVDIDGDEADVRLDVRGTPAANAAASLVRLQASKTIDKTCNKVTVLGPIVRHVKLQYLGGKTPTATDPQKKLMLQHGWTPADIDLSSYAATIGAQDVLDSGTIDVTGNTVQWNERYTTLGRLFGDYKHAGRLFVWNESGDFVTPSESTNRPIYGPTADLAYVVPDLSGIADGEDADAGKYCRRRRRMLDTTYLQAGTTDSWRREPATLLLAAAAPNDDTTIGKWVRVPTSHWHVDTDQAAVWITAPDLATWCPLAHVQDPAEATVPDGRSFATLLYTGKLRMTLEGSIRADSDFAQLADRQDVSGSPLVREALIRQDQEFIKSEVYSDGVTSQLGLTPAVLDTTDKALTLAQQYRNAGQDMATHASFLTNGDWPLQGIGKVINTIKGREIDFRGGVNGGGRGSQIVALSLDPASCTVELLSHSDAMKLRRQDKLRKAKRAKGNTPLAQRDSFDGTAASSSGGDFA